MGRICPRRDSIGNVAQTSEARPCSSASQRSKTRPCGHHTPPPPPLAADDVHVWQVSLEQPAPVLARLSRLLDHDERQRRDRFFFERDQRRFTVARGVLRLLLASYLAAAPESLCFCYSPQGKPALCGNDAHTRLRFNLSHSHERALYAITWQRDVGIDIEYQRPIERPAQLAQRFFSGEEYTALLSLSAAQQQEAFFNAWTRKEAFLKARGTGLAHALASVHVSLAPGDRPALLRLDLDGETLDDWRLEAISPAADYAAALVVRGHHWRLGCYTCDTGIW